MESSMFLREITVIDHAYIDADGRQYGGSFLASFDVVGKLDRKERVVVDFSTIKKDIKSIIDHKDTGFDHKLWVMSLRDSVAEISNIGSSEISIKTQCLEITAPRDIVKHVPVTEYSIPQIERVIAAQVEYYLNQKYPNAGLLVRCSLSQIPVSATGATKMFSYTHGLKDSTSWGCQNIAHGHLSFIELHGNLAWRAECEDCMKAREEIFSVLEREWDNAILINPENIIEDTPDYIAIGYKSPRGAFYAKYKKPWCKIKVLKGETTIELITEEFTDSVKYWIERGHIGRVEISEGLSKGSFKEY